MISQRHVRDGEPADRAVESDPRALLIGERTAGAHGGGRLRFDVDHVLFGPQLRQAMAEHVFALLVQRLEQRAIDDGQAVLGVHRVNDLGQAVDERAEQDALFFQRGLRRSAARDDRAPRTARD